MANEVIVTPGNQTSENKFAIWSGIVTASLMTFVGGLYAVFPNSLYLDIAIAVLSPLAQYFSAKTVHDNRTALKIAAIKANVDHAAIVAGVFSPSATAATTSDEIEKKP